jgi:predicted dehydrogenase
MDVGVIGTGIMGKNHVRVYSESKSVESLSVFDVNHAAAEEVARTFRITAHQTIDELLRNVDAVSICVPTRFHYDIARKCIEQGVHMLIEKPICNSMAEADLLVDLLPKDLVVGVGHIERFNPIVKEISRIIRHPLYVEAKRHNPASLRVTGSTVVEDLMIHDIDVIFNLFSHESYTVHSRGNDDICSALFTLNHLPIYLSASRKSSKKIRMIYIEEEDRTIEGDFMTQEIFVYRKPDQYHMENERYVQENIIEKVLVNKVEPLKLELATFLHCIEDGTQFPITPQQGLHNLRVCEYIKNSFESGDGIRRDAPITIFA